MSENVYTGFHPLVLGLPTRPAKALYVWSLSGKSNLTPDIFFNLVLITVI